MDIKSNSLYAQMQSMQLEAMGNRISTNNNVEAVSEAANTSGSDFGALLKNAVNTVNDLQKETGELRNRFEMGDRSVSLSDTMIASAKSGIAFEATVQVRNKFVEAYKEIMSMPV